MLKKDDFVCLCMHFCVFSPQSLFTPLAVSSAGCELSHAKRLMNLRPDTHTHMVRARHFGKRCPETCSGASAVSTDMGAHHCRNVA